MINPAVVNNNDGTYTVQHACQCGHVTVAEVDGYDFFRYYYQNEFVQVAFPYLSDATREALFISGVCAVCWHNMFGDDED